MIDNRIRARGIGGSDVCAVVGLDTRRDRFSVYADKLGLVKRQPPNARMRRGKYLERGVVAWYGDERRCKCYWFDETIRHPDREWQVVSPDAFVISSEASSATPIYVPAAGIQALGMVDAKTVSWDQAYEWGETGSDKVPDRVSLQLQWACSTTGLPWSDAAAICGLDDLRIYRIHFDADLEAVLLEECEKFWREHVLARVAPPIGCTETAKEYLRQRFPRNVEVLRQATGEEEALLMRLKLARDEFNRAEQEKESLSNEVKQLIGDADGLNSSLGKVTWRKDADSVGVDWEKVARELGWRVELLKRYALVADQTYPDWWAQTFEQLAAQSQIVTKHGARKLLCPRNWK